MNSDEIVLTIHTRYITRNNGITRKEFLKSIKSSLRLINERRSRNCEPYAGCPCECPLNVSCTRCWDMAIEQFVCIGNNIPVL